MFSLISNFYSLLFIISFGNTDTYEKAKNDLFDYKRLCHNTNEEQKQELINKVPPLILG